MTRADDYILEFLAEHNIVVTPHVVSANIDYNRQYVNQRIRKLADNGLVENTERGLYRITDRGRSYLAGELDASELENGD